MASIIILPGTNQGPARFAKSFCSLDKETVQRNMWKCDEFGHSSNNSPNNNKNNNNIFQFQTRTHGNNWLSGYNNNTSRDKSGSNKICNWCDRNGHVAKECKSKEGRERFLNQQKERKNTAIKEEDYIEKTDEDYQSDNESVAEVGFIATEGIVKEEAALACIVDSVNYTSFTDKHLERYV